MKRKLYIALLLISMCFGCNSSEVSQTEKFATLPVKVTLPAYLNQIDSNFILNNDGHLFQCDEKLLSGKTLNHFYETTGTTVFALALRELDSPISDGKVVFEM